MDSIEKLSLVNTLKFARVSLGEIRTQLNKAGLLQIEGLDNRLWRGKPLTPTQFYRVKTGW